MKTGIFVLFIAVSLAPRIVPGTCRCSKNTDSMEERMLIL